MIKFSIKNAFRRKSITFLAILGVGLGCSLMTVLLSISQGMNKKLDQTMNKLAGNIVVSSKDAPMAMIVSDKTLPMLVGEEIRQMSGVKGVVPKVTVVIPEEVVATGNPMGVNLAGVEINIDSSTDGPTAHIISGRTINNKNEIIISKTMREYFQRQKISGFEIGDKISIPINLNEILKLQAQKKTQSTGNLATQQTATQEPEKINLEIVGIFESSNTLDEMYLYGDIETVRKIAGLNNDEVHNFRVIADNAEIVDNLAEAIENKFINSAYPVTTFVAKDILAEINETAEIFDQFLLAIAIVAAVAGGMAILIIMLMSVMERLVEFGILKASGWSNRNLIFSVMIESLTLSLLGSTVGFGLGVVGVNILRYFIYEDIGIITFALACQVIFFGVVMGVIGGFYPSFRAAKVSPIKTLKGM